jgi:hypothetical protein
VHRATLTVHCPPQPEYYKYGPGTISIWVEHPSGDALVGLCTTGWPAEGTVIASQVPCDQAVFPNLDTRLDYGIGSTEGTIHNVGYTVTGLPADGITIDVVMP